jgi:hypothetical protein
MMATAAPRSASEAFDINAGIIKLAALAANLRAHRPIPRHSEPQQIAGLFNIDDFPEPSPEYDAAEAALGNYADELAGIGGLALMVDVYDGTVEALGWRAVSGVSPAWDNHAGWAH